MGFVFNKCVRTIQILHCLLFCFFLFIILRMQQACGSVGRVLAKHTQGSGFNDRESINWVQEHIPLIPALGRWSDIQGHSQRRGEPETELQIFCLWETEKMRMNIQG